MDRTLITFHIPSHRRRALELQGASLEAEQTYDANIGDYVRFLQAEAAKAGYAVASDKHDIDAVFTIDELDHQQKKAAHAWLETQPDLWNWIP